MRAAAGMSDGGHVPRDNKRSLVINPVNFCCGLRAEEYGRADDAAEG